MKYLWVDDERAVSKFFNGGNAVIARNYNDAIDRFVELDDGTELVCISFDHDLGSKKTGYDFAKWLVEHNVVGAFKVHSFNPVGATNIRQLLLHYGWKELF